MSLISGTLKMLAPIVPLLIVSPIALAQTETQTLSVVLSPAVSITTPQSVTLSPTGTTFGNFTSPSVNIQFKVRNTQTTGAGSITLKATEFSPNTGPKIANGNLTYACSASSIGTACSGTQTLSTTTATPVVTFPASACTGTGCPGSSPQSVQVRFTLSNSALYKTGTYSATLTFTISAT